ncbi:MAG: alginate export family protein [Bacteroidota bacterium]
MKKISHILVSAVLLFLVTHQAQAQFTADLEIRPRAEFRNGFKALKSDGDDPAFFVEQRSRLYFQYSEEKIKVKLVLQDVRLWGENSQIFKTDNALFNVFEAWGSYKLGDKSLIKVGRQALDYDNARILGNLAWAQQARSHDLAKYEYNADQFKLHIGAAFNQEDLNSRPEPARLTSTFYSGVNNYKTMQYVWVNQKYDQGNTSLLILNNGVQAADSTINFSQTVGLYSKNKFGKIGLTGELYHQFGQAISGVDLSAWMVSLALSHHGDKNTFTIGGDHLTGTASGSTQSNSFTPLYGTNHKFYGLMDYFYVGNPFGDVGLTDLYAKWKVTIKNKSSLAVHLHQFLSGVDLSAEFTSAPENTLGTEVDLVYNLQVDKAVNLKIGYSQMFATSSMELLKGGNQELFQNWGWVMLTIKPRLFTLAKEN